MTEEITNSYIEIRWSIPNGDEPESGTWRRTIETRRVTSAEMSNAVTEAIRTIRNELGVKAP